MLANRVCHEGDKVWIEGVEGFCCDQYASSVHGSQTRMLQTLGESLTYEDLIGYSGFAFRVGWHEVGCPSAGHPCCGYRCIENSIRALPWQLKMYESSPWCKPKGDRGAFEAQACAAIKASIDRGVPVHYGREEDGLIMGYADEGQRWLCVHPYNKGGSETFWHDEASGFAGGAWPWIIVVWTGPKALEDRVDGRDLLTAALKQAVDMWGHQTDLDPDHRPERVYFTGDMAYAPWIGWLRAIEVGELEDPKAGIQGNAWCFHVLVHSRRIASRWLTQQADRLEGQAHQHLLDAAGHYQKLVDVCMKDLDSSWALAPGPGQFDQWTSAMRTEQIARLQVAQQHDANAIDAITKALATQTMSFDTP